MKPKPIFYCCCQSDDCIKNQEVEWDMTWITNAPQLGTLISLGGEARWRIVKITTFRPQTVQDIDSLYVAYVHPIGLPIPPESEWDFETIYEPPLSVSADLVFAGQIDLTAGMGEGIDIPEIGELIESSIEPTEDGINILETDKVWTRTRVVTYLPVEETRIATLDETTFAKAFLCWCEPVECSSMPSEKLD